MCLVSSISKQSDGCALHLPRSRSARETPHLLCQSRLSYSARQSLRCSVQCRCHCGSGCLWAGLNSCWILHARSGSQAGPGPRPDRLGLKCYLLGGGGGNFMYLNHNLSCMAAKRILHVCIHTNFSIRVFWQGWDRTNILQMTRLLVCKFQASNLSQYLPTSQKYA